MSDRERLQRLEANRRWAARNREAERQRKREWARENRARIRLRARQRYAETGGSVERAAWARRKARKLAAPSDHWTYGDVRAKSNDCYLCGRPIGSSRWEADHVVPLARGGSNLLANMMPVHERCNRVKGTRLPEEMIA